MKLYFFIAAVICLCYTSCSKKTQTQQDPNTNYTFRTFKNDSYWQVKELSAIYNEKDSMIHVFADGPANERFSLSYFLKPKYVGKWESYRTNIIVPSCEHCASIAKAYSLDTTRNNSFEIMGFEDKVNRIWGRFTFHFKSDSLYAGSYVKDAMIYRGLFSIPYKVQSF